MGTRERSQSRTVVGKGLTDKTTSKKRAEKSGKGSHTDYLGGEKCTREREEQIQSLREEKMPGRAWSRNGEKAMEAE